MSYCVNCGVELASSEKKCPLCGVEAINPADPRGPESYDKAYPPAREPMQAAFDRDLWIRIVSVMLAVPAAICIVSNLVYQSAVFWSFYVVGALVVAWTCGVSPFLFKRYFPNLWILAVTGVTLGYLFLIEHLSGAPGWFLPLALPIVLGVAAVSLALILLIKNKLLKDLYTPAAVFLSMGLLTVLIEFSLDLYARGTVQLGWSLFSFISCAAMAGMLMLIEHKLKLKEKMKRRLHI